MSRFNLLQWLDRRGQRIPLQVLLSVPFFLLTTVATGLVSYFSYRSGQQAVKDLAQQVMQETGDRTDLYLQQLLHQPLLVNQLTADAIQLGHLTGLESANADSLTAYLRQQLQRFPAINRIAIANQRDEWVIVGHWPAGQNTGQPITQEAPLPVRLPWYRAAVVARKPIWSPLYALPGSAGLALAAGLPVYSRSGDLRGVVTTEIALSPINRFLQQLSLSRSGAAFILDTSGKLVASSTAEPFLLAGPPTQQQLQARGHSAQLTQETVQGLTQRLHSLSGLAEPMTLQLMAAGDRQFVQIRPFRHSDGLNWLTVIVLPESALNRMADKSLRWTSWLATVTIFLTLALGGLILRWLTRPLRRLNVAAKRVAQGDFDFPLDIDRPDEVGELANSFNTMAQRLRESFERLQTALQRSEEKFTKIFQASPDPITISRLADGRWVDVNQSFLNLTGYRYEEVVGFAPQDLNLLVEPTELETVSRQLREQGSVHNLEMHWLTKSGEIKTSLLSCEIIGLEGQPYVLTVAKDIGDRKQVEAALAQERAHLAAAQKLAHVGSWELELDTLHISWSDESFRIYGRQPGQPPPSFTEHRQQIHPQDYPLWNQAMQRLIVDKQPADVEFRIIRPDGSIRHLLGRGQPVFNAQGQVTRLFGTILDITDRKQSEAALRRSEETNRALLQAIPDLLIRMHRDGTYLDIRPTQTFPVLVSISEMLGANVRQILPTDLAQQRLQAAEKALDTGEIQVYEYPLQVGDQRQWREVRVVPLGVDDVLLVVRDLTARKQTEEALRKSEERWQLAISGSNDGIWDHDLVTNQHFLSPRCLEILGYDQQEIDTFQKWIRLIHPDDLGTVQTTLQKHLDRQTPYYACEYRVRCQDGSYKWILSRGKAIWNDQGRPIRAIGSITDISDRREVERLKDEFISIVSHELRTPLTAIRGSLGLLETGIYADKPEKTRRMIEIALNNSDRLVHLVNDILDLERLESGKLQLVMEGCEVAELMQQAVEAVQAIADLATVQIVATPLAARIWAAPDAIVQTLTNLLSNAIKFSPTGSTVWLSAEVVDPRKVDPLQGQQEPVKVSTIREMGRTVMTSVSATLSSTIRLRHSPAVIRFKVQDQGRGIPADKLNTIFGRFQQVDVSDSRQKGGSGLGLAICQSIVQQHGGRIWAESVLGQGSTFYFTVPTSRNPA